MCKSWDDLFRDDLLSVIMFYVKIKVVKCEDKGDSEEEMLRFVMW